MPNLQDIRTKVRRLTRSPSTAQISDADLDTYINTFVLYDFPEHLRTFNLRTQYTFYTNPFQDVYDTNIIGYGGDADGTGGVTSNPLYNFQNLYYTVHDPVYIAGFQSFYSQSREQFFAVYPNINSIQQIGIGDGIATQFTGFIGFVQPLQPNNPGLQGILQNQVMFDGVDIDNNGLNLVDVPLMDGNTGNNSSFGNLFTPNNFPGIPRQIYPADLDANNNINYATGQFIVTFPRPPKAGTPINSQTVPVVLARPQALLFYANQFIVRPVPDQPYRINFEVYKRPTALLAAGNVPDLEEYWQFIAYGAARKVLQDRMDLETIVLIEPEYKKQMNLIQRRTIVQYTNERTATIYTEQVALGSGHGGFGWGSGGPF